MVGCYNAGVALARLTVEGQERRGFESESPCLTSPLSWSQTWRFKARSVANSEPITPDIPQPERADAKKFLAFNAFNNRVLFFRVLGP